MLCDFCSSFSCLVSVYSTINTFTKGWRSITHIRHPPIYAREIQFDKLEIGQSGGERDNVIRLASTS